MRDDLRPGACLSVLLLFLAVADTARAGLRSVEEWTPTLEVCRETMNAVSWLALRRFTEGGRAQLFLVDPGSLRTRLAASPEVSCQPTSWPDVFRRYADTPYVGALNEARAHESPLEDAGVVHAANVRRGLDLTVDLCPSRRPLDRPFFEGVIDAFRATERPVPVSIAVTGMWMDEHPDELAWLLSRVRDGSLSITWINHTYHHRWSHHLPEKRNFLLEPGTDVAREILSTEEAIVRRGMLPSVFLRFPGLVSSRALVERSLGLGLIVLGSDAWLAKNQQAVEGSIVLVHANGNEPLGLQEFLSLLRRERQRIAERRWILYDLRESLTGGQRLGGPRD